MNTEEMKQRFYSLYNTMANSHEVANMRTFGNVHKMMMEELIANNPKKAEEYLDILESIKWKNYLSPKEAEQIVGDMVPSAPWSREQWKSAMEKHGFDLDKEPCYNKCALWAVMNMKMSDSGKTLEKYIGSDKLFDAVYELAVDSLTDKDGNFNVRTYFGL